MTGLMTAAAARHVSDGILVSIDFTLWEIVVTSTGRAEKHFLLGPAVTIKSQSCSIKFHILCRGEHNLDGKCVRTVRGLDWGHRGDISTTTCNY